jgi:hypothetical protein
MRHPTESCPLDGIDTASAPAPTPQAPNPSTIQLDELTGDTPVVPDAAGQTAPDARCDRENGQWSRWRRSLERAREYPSQLGSGKGPCKCPTLARVRCGQMGTGRWAARSGRCSNC